ncbi:hypothetical protein OM416_15265 [Paenibacillus sp. LS1]|uniref:DUF6979 family protein n=1 Tax=Paenibacillus sp. LS1 TaxID=2992120 RepID=UPI0022317D8F|nr:hypothetical protein [Paenibacillus sp. LS1]MCW3792949.1 hypothetical protein [Paenibacillus sp. LS1]
MGKYGEAAVKTVNYLNEHKHDDPIKAWNEVTIQIFGKGSSSQKKGCPENTFLGLCEEGLLEGIPSGIYTNSKKNKGYGLKAVKILGEIDNDKDINQRALWKEVIGDQDIKYNSQMNVVLALWREGMIRL